MSNVSPRLKGQSSDGDEIDIDTFPRGQVVRLQSKKSDDVFASFSPFLSHLKQTNRADTNARLN